MGNNTVNDTELMQLLAIFPNTTSERACETLCWFTVKINMTCNGYNFLIEEEQCDLYTLDEEGETEIIIHGVPKLMLFFEAAI